MLKKNLNIKIDSELYCEYKKFCEENSYNLSERLRQFIQLDVNYEDDLLKKIKRINEKM